MQQLTSTSLCQPIGSTYVTAPTTPGQPPFWPLPHKRPLTEMLPAEEQLDTAYFNEGPERKRPRLAVVV